MKQAVQFVLRVYKRFVSPMLPHSCRFVPTCSEYAMEAVERNGVLRGALLAAGRLLRCHPFARAGYDPPPRQFKGEKWRTLLGGTEPATFPSEGVNGGLQGTGPKLG